MHTARLQRLLSRMIRLLRIRFLEGVSKDLQLVLQLLILSGQDLNIFLELHDLGFEVVCAMDTIHKPTQYLLNTILDSICLIMSGEKAVNQWREGQITPGGVLCNGTQLLFKCLYLWLDNLQVSILQKVGCQFAQIGYERSHIALDVVECLL